VYVGYAKPGVSLGRPPSAGRTRDTLHQLVRARVGQGTQDERVHALKIAVVHTDADRQREHLRPL
jgi:acid stress-induced BolA-like protein IbaG/YrbA